MNKKQRNKQINKFYMDVILVYHDARGLVRHYRNKNN